MGRFHVSVPRKPFLGGETSSSLSTTNEPDVIMGVKPGNRLLEFNRNKLCRRSARRGNVMDSNVGHSPHSSNSFCHRVSGFGAEGGTNEEGNSSNFLTPIKLVSE